MMKALVIGAAGQLGAATVERLRNAPTDVDASKIDVIALTRAEIDLANGRALRDAVLGVKPDVILNCAAYNNVDGAEDDPRTALDVNAFAPRVLAEAAEETGATLVHYSTDFVFDGEGVGTLHRSRSRASAERLRILEAARRVVRRAGAAALRPARREPVRRHLRAQQHRQDHRDHPGRRRHARVLVDRVVTPSYVQDVITATLALIDKSAPYGLYHCVNSEHTTWYELAREVARPARAAGVARAGEGGRGANAGAASAVLRAVESQDWPKRASRCRPGRTRSGATSK